MIRKYYVLLPIIIFYSLRGIAQIDTTTVPRDSLNDLEAELIPTFITSADELESDVQSQDVSGLLQSSRDVFTSVAGFNFSAARFRMRGYGSENFKVMINGVPMNDPETGWAIWANWGGLNDVTRYPDGQTGISANQYHFGGIGGFSAIDMRASQLRKGTRISYAVSNRTYRHRTMVTHSTGMMENGWAITASASKRWAKEGYIEGTFYDAYAYFLSAEKKLNEKHSIGFTGFGAPITQGRQGIAQQEAYDLAGSNYYNPYWGYQDGEKRNSRIRNGHKPTLFLTHTWKPNDKTDVNTSVYYQFGRYGQTRLNWDEAKDPRPDYYRYLPSYFENETAHFNDDVTAAWQNDVNTRQVNWDQLYFANSKNIYLFRDVDGQTGNNVTGTRAKYILEELRVDPRWMGINSTVNRKMNDKLMVSGGLHLMRYKSKNFKVMNDLLGAEYWLDVDRFAEEDYENPDAAQSDLNNPNKLIRQGDKFGYDYDINKDMGEFFGQAQYTTKKVDFYGALTASYTSFWRTGHLRNGLFPDNSFGDSQKQNYFNYGIKAGAVYKLTGRHFLAANGAYLTRPPSLRNVFVSPRTRDAVAPGLTDEKILSGDLNYHLRYPKVKARVTLFYTQINDQVWLRNYYHDGFNSFVNYAMKGVDHLHTGIEAGVQGTIASVIVVSGAFTKADYLFNSRPTASITVDNSTELLAENRTIYLKNYRLGGMPQTAASIGVKYNAPQFWWVGVDFNYFTDIYLEAAPDRRTSEAVTKYVTDDPQWGEIIDQEKVDDGYTLNAFAGKSFRIKRKYFLMITLNVSNILNNREFITGGFEQLRADYDNPGRFPSKYSYMYGTTYFGMLSLRF